MPVVSLKWRPRELPYKTYAHEMVVAVIGANGGIGRRLLPRLDNAGHEPLGVVRSEDQFDAVRERGGEPRLGDLEGEFASALDGADAVVLSQPVAPPAPAVKTTASAPSSAGANSPSKSPSRGSPPRSRIVSN